MNTKKLRVLAALMLGLAAPVLAQNVPNYVPTNGLVGWWPFNGNANDESGNGNNGTVNGATLISDRFGNVNNAYSFGGTDWIEVANSNSIKPSVISISLWAYVEPIQPNGSYTRIISKNYGEPQNFGSYQILTGLSSGYGSTGVTVRTGAGNSQTTPGIYKWSGPGASNLISQWQHIVGTFDGSQLKFYQNGILSSTTAFSGTLFYDSGNLWFGKGITGAAIPGTNMFFNGKIDDIGIWNRALTQQEITTLYQATPCVAPSASITPAGPTTFCSGASVTLNANNGSGLLYQWVKDGVNIPNATAASYVATASGNYTVVVSDAGNCSATSSSTSVTVNALPNANITPAGATTFCSGASVVLNANTGSGLTHQWVKDGVNIANAASASYTATTSGNYAVVVTNSNNCSASSSAINVTVNPAPNASAAAAGATTFCAGGSVVLNANTGSGLQYQWKKNGTNISGATAAGFNATTTGSYTVVVSNSNGCSASSSAISVTVNPLPSVQLSSLPAFVNIQAGNVPLNGTPSGGTYSGSGVLGSSFSPTTAGLGSAGVTYAYTTPEGCSGSASQTTIVYDTTGIVCTSYDTVTTYTTVTDTLIINTTLTGINPPNNTNTIKIFPNPANDHITIHYGNVALMSGYQLRIQNSLGQQVFSTNINQPSSFLSLANWGGNGLYFVYLIDPQGNTLDIRKIVLQ